MNPRDSEKRTGASGRSRRVWFIAAGCLLVTLLGIFWPRPKSVTPSSPASEATPGQTRTAVVDAPRAVGTSQFARQAHRPSNAADAPSAEKIVAEKLVRFAQSRRELTRALGKHLHVEVPDEVERFFDAVESGNWDEIDAAFNALRGEYASGPRRPELHPIWRPIQETWGAAREAHTWPAQQFLDYGAAVLGSLRPGMVYVGGTDPGCFIATMLNETSDGERHIVLTQNALADSTYLDYLGFLYGDRLATLTQEDSQRAFQNYIEDAQKRLQHDKQFPNETSQVLPGEEIRSVDGKLQVSGQVAVMAVNERLFQTLMDKNSDASFAIEHSFPFKSTYAESTPLGPILELRVRDEQNALTAERADQSIEYWRGISQQLLSDSSLSDSRDVLRAYSKLASEQASLFLDRNYAAQAEDTFRLAIDLAPESPEAVFRLVNLLFTQGRSGEAIPVAERAVKAAPENQQFRGLLEQLRRQRGN